MMNVLVVEDELPTARLIAKLVRQHPDCTVAGMETDGESALEFLRSHPVDLIITDIQMPIMDGLQLLEAVHRDYPQCITVMLTGFSQFDYARTALQLRAFDYLLKPIDSREFARVLNQVRDVLSQCRREEARQRLRQALDGMPVESDGCTYRLLLAQAPAALWQDWEQMLPPEMILLSGGAETERIAAVPADTWSLARVEAACRPVPGLNMILGPDPVPISALKQTVDAMREALNRQTVLFQSRLYRMDGVLPHRETPLRNMQPELAAAAVCAGDRSELTRCLRQMWTVSQRSGALRSHVQAYFAAVLMDPRIAQQTAPEQLHRIQLQLQDILLRAESAEGCTDALCGCLTALRQAPASRRDTARQMAEIAHYLQTNYYMPITVETLARQYGFVPKTLNRLFRQYQGSRPAEYLQELRVRQAQHLLETRPDLMIKDIAASVGFPDQHYFSKVFQKTTGHWPTEYQQSAQK